MLTVDGIRHLPRDVHAPQPAAALQIGQLEFHMHGDATHERRVEIFDKIRREDNEVLIVIQDHEHNRPRLIDAHVGSAGHVRHTLAQDGVRFVEEEDAVRFLRRIERFPYILRCLAHVLRLDVRVIHR